MYEFVNQSVRLFGDQPFYLNASILSDKTTLPQLANALSSFHLPESLSNSSNCSSDQLPGFAPKRSTQIEYMTKRKDVNDLSQSRHIPNPMYVEFEATSFQNSSQLLSRPLASHFGPEARRGDFYRNAKSMKSDFRNFAHWSTFLNPRTRQESFGVLKFSNFESFRTLKLTRFGRKSRPKIFATLNRQIGEFKGPKSLILG